MLRSPSPGNPNCRPSAACCQVFRRPRDNLEPATSRVHYPATRLLSRRARSFPMAVDRRILETLESCRPGSDDLEGIEFADVAERIERDAELASLASAIERWDLAVTAAIDDVAVPEGLGARLLERLSVRPAKSSTASEDAA